MSYIDTFDHEYVADFAGMPLYHPIVSVEGAGGEDFACSPRNLVLGGGSGEHPALVLKHLSCLALHFVTHAIPDEEESTTFHDQFRDDPIINHLDCEYSELFEYASWSVHDFHSFYERCSSLALNLPYDADSSLSFEDWLAISIGELVWFSLPDLIQDLDRVRERYPNLQPIAWNVLMPPLGYPTKFGRKFQDGEVIWGNSRFCIEVAK